MTPAQCKSARGLLSMTRRRLAIAAGVDKSTVNDFERSRRQVSPQAIAAMRAVLVRAGVVFYLDDGKHHGVAIWNG